MKKSRKILTILMSLVLTLSLSACSSSAAKSSGASSSASESTSKSQGKKVKAIATIFPQYDFLKQIGKDHVEVSMLLKPGAESHSFEPSPQDIKNVEGADVFVYVGGDSDKWVKDILESVDKSNTHIVTLMDCVDLVEEETAEGMTPEKEEEGEGEEEGPEYDEHVWTSPRNAKLIVKKLCDTLCEVDPDNSSDYKKNTEEYTAQLDKLDGEFKEVVDNGKRKEIVVGDRFPFRYFVDAYGLKYYAAFPGCATETEANPSTIAFLTDKVKKDKIPVVFHIELSNAKMCDSICEDTGAKSELLNAVHNVSKEDFDKGATYMSLMEHNVKVLKEALN